MYHRRSWFSCTPSLQTWHAKSSRLRGWMASANRMNSAEYMHIAVVIFGEIISGGFFVSARPCRRAIDVSRTPVGVVSQNGRSDEAPRTATTKPQLATGPQKWVVFGPVGEFMYALSCGRRPLAFAADMLGVARFPGPLFCTSQPSRWLNSFCHSANKGGVQIRQGRNCKCSMQASKPGLLLQGA